MGEKGRTGAEADAVNQVATHQVATKQAGGVITVGEMGKPSLYPICYDSE